MPIGVTTALLLLLTATPSFAARRAQLVQEDTVFGTVDCSIAKMCDCGECNPDTCLVKTKDGDSCMWPPDMNFCVAWKQEQCAPVLSPGHRPPNPFANFPLPGKHPALKPIRPAEGANDASVAEQIAALQLQINRATEAGDYDKIAPLVTQIKALQERLQSDGEEIGDSTSKAPVVSVEEDAPVRIVDCGMAPMCDCGRCSPDECLVNAKDGKGCHWPTSRAFCVAWKKEQCEPIVNPGFRPPNPFAGMPLPTRKPVLPTVESSTTTPIEVPVEEQEVAVEEEEEEGVTVVDCGLAPMCDCSLCSPTECLVHVKWPGKGCRWPTNFAFCAAWKKEQCESFSRPTGPNPLFGGMLPGMGGARPTLRPIGGSGGPDDTSTTAQKGLDDLLPGRLPGLGDATGGRAALKPVQRRTTTKAPEDEYDGPEDKPLCKGLQIAPPCKMVYKNMCPRKCAEQ